MGKLQAKVRLGDAAGGCSNECAYGHIEIWPCAEAEVYPREASSLSIRNIERRMKINSEQRKRRKLK